MKVDVQLTMGKIEYKTNEGSALEGLYIRPLFFQPNKFVVNSPEKGKTYTLQSSNGLRSALFGLSWLVAIIAFMVLENPLLLLLFALIMVMQFAFPEHYDYTADENAGERVTRFNKLSRRWPLLMLNNDEYEISHHSNNSYAVMKNGDQVAIIMDKNLGTFVSSAKGNFEIVHANEMDGKEHILLLLFMFADARRRSRRNRGARRMERRSEKMLFDKDAERANWRPQDSDSSQ